MGVVLVVVLVGRGSGGGSKSCRPGTRCVFELEALGLPGFRLFVSGLIGREANLAASRLTSR